MKDQEIEVLTQTDYEDSYAEALLILREKYDNVGLPYQRNGVRVCDVETLHADDLTVFMLAWGSEIAHQIESGRLVNHEGRTRDRQGVQTRSAASWF